MTEIEEFLRNIHHAQDKLHRGIEGAQRTINNIRYIIDQARLNGQEREYIRLRYFENKSVIQIEEIMYQTHTYRIKESALEKIEKALESA